MGSETSSKTGVITLKYPLYIFGIQTKRFLLYMLAFAFILYNANLLSYILKQKNVPMKTIFVSIASYRDIFCMKTLQQLFKNAKYPERIFVGIVQQNSDRDPDCLTVENLEKSENVLDLEKLLKYRDQIRIHRMEYHEAKGPVYARYLVIEKHYRGEDYIFQIDSHTRFAPNWDTLLISNIERLPPKSCISHYPLEYDYKSDTLSDNWRNKIPRMCHGFYNNDEILQPVGSIFARDGRSYEGMFLAAGMSFYPGSAHKEVPIDPYLKHLFHGEELLFSVRMAAHGYRFFSPSDNVCFHFYYRKDFPKSWDTNLRDADYFSVQRQSLHRTKYILGLMPREQVENATYSLLEVEKYGINYNDPQIRTNVDNYYQKFGIDLRLKKIENFCMKSFPVSY